MEVWQAAALVAATITTGLLAGLLAAFSYAIMPGLRRADDRTLVSTMQQVNVAILNPLFIVIYIGAPVLTALAAVLHLAEGQRRVLAWLVAALVLSVATFVITAARNIPLNNLLAAAGEPARHPDLAAVRRRFERPWARWNLVRAVTSTAALGCLGLALWVD